MILLVLHIAKMSLCCEVISPFVIFVDDLLFKAVLKNSHHVLYPYFPEDWHFLTSMHNLISSMPDRLETVIRNKGDAVSY